MYYSYMLYQAEHPRTLGSSGKRTSGPDSWPPSSPGCGTDCGQGGPRREEAQPPRASGTVDACRIPVRTL